MKDADSNAVINGSIQLIGMVCIVAGAWSQWGTAAGLLALGFFAILIGSIGGKRTKP
ncbi:MAG: hypothetical protein U1E62_05305 [Alsobacter sp.]